MLAVLPYILHGMFNREISLWYTMLTIFDGINSLLGCHKNQEGYEMTCVILVNFGLLWLYVMYHFNILK